MLFVVSLSMLRLAIFCSGNTSRLRQESVRSDAGANTRRAGGSGGTGGQHCQRQNARGQRQSPDYLLLNGCQTYCCVNSR